ncbi:MAG: hypothetical protein QOF62_3257 [Pyrinomonadaceae bacterium]|jgi:hypothetical protein|nr:hypothetical protein [Pyrinomonadaceae bacterium]
MPISRRKFIGTGSLAALAVGLPLKAAAGALHRTNSPFSALGQLRNSAGAASLLDRNALSQCLKTEFRITGEYARTVRTKLVEVYDWKPTATTRSRHTATKECFSAVFLGPTGGQLKQGTYKVEHATLGNFSMFLVPGAKSLRGNYYEAVFNRL